MIGIIFSISAIHTEMKEGILAPQTDYASKPLRDRLKRGSRINVSFVTIIKFVFAEAAQKANQVFLPVLENASRAQKLRTTLGVFERSKFFFNLPSFIIESVEAVGRSFPLKERYLNFIRDAMTLPCETTKRENTCSSRAQINYFPYAFPKIARLHRRPNNSRRRF